MSTARLVRPGGLGTPRLTDVVVVGGGVMGSAAAWALARRGVGVVLLERFGPGHTRGASHGRARIYRSTYAEPHHQALVAEARRLWAELEAETGTTLLHPASGVASAAGPGQERLRGVAAAMSRAGVPFEWLSAAEAAGRWPGMRFPGPVLHEPSTAGRPGRRLRGADLVHVHEHADRRVVLDRIGPVVVAAGFSGHGFTSAPAVGRVLADLALGTPAGAERFTLDAHAVLR